jgi:hypothetical protein
MGPLTALAGKKGPQNLVISFHFQLKPRDAQQTLMYVKAP